MQRDLCTCETRQHTTTTSYGWRCAIELERGEGSFHPEVHCSITQDAQSFKCPPKDGQYEDPIQCDKFYECNDGRATERLCPDGLVFDPTIRKINKCDQPFNVDCGDRVDLQPPRGNTLCPRRNGFFAHPDPAVCNVFYNCIEGEANEISCTAGLHFDEYTGTCVWPSDAGRQGCNPGANKKLKDGFTCPKDQKTDQAGQVVAHPKFAHPTDCQRFYVCLNGVEPRDLGCQVGEVYNEETERCDAPENVPGCDGRYERQCVDSVAATVARSDHAQFKCPKSRGQFEDAVQCDKYYVCDEGEATEKICPDGLVFDPTIKLVNKCDQPFNVDCGERFELQPPQGTTDYCPRKNGYFSHPDPTICNVFYSCINGEELEMSCTGSLHFDEKSGTCVWPDVAAREGCGSNANKKLNDGFQCPKETRYDKNGQVITHPNYPHPTDCSRFYYCLNGVEPRLGQCDAKMVYNEDLQRCDDPANVPECYLLALLTFGSGSGLPGYCGSVATSWTARIGRRDLSEGANKKSITLDNIRIEVASFTTHTMSRRTHLSLPILLAVVLVCSAADESDDYFEFTCPKPDGQFPDPYQCDKYYECNDGRVSENLCPDGLVFNPASKLVNKCDQVFNVDCGDRKELQKPKPIGVCPRQNGFFAHPDESICNTFYNCINGREIEMTCVAGLHFNEPTGTCVWPEMANREGCGSNANKKLNDGFQCPKNAQKMDKNGQIIVHPNYAHPDDCQRFYICLNGVEPRLGTCEQGKVYNEDLERCDDPENVTGCEDWYSSSETDQA
uniref:Chitin-binding type-2 domain-containing protein n=1 Tax=Anopheles christyi TaxID=43041 RepID=A0A182K5K0_9DIPT